MTEVRLLLAMLGLAVVVHLLPSGHPAIAKVADLVNDLGFGEKPE